jgi:hypothetical protein
MAAIAAAMRARLLAADNILQTGDMDAANKVRFSKLQRVAFVSEVRNSQGVSAAQYADLSALALTVPWAPGDLNLVMAELEHRIDGIALPQVQRRRSMQDYLAFLDYVSMATWTVLKSETASSATKLEILCQSLVDMYCVNPSEHTLKLASALYIVLVHSSDSAIAMSSEEKGVVKKTLKEAHKRLARRMASFDNTLYVSCLGDVDSLRASNRLLHDAIFNGREPVVCQVDSVLVKSVFDSFQCRNNIALTTSTALAIPRPAVGEAMNMQMMLMSVMERMMDMQRGNNGSRRREQDDDIPISFSADAPRSGADSVRAALRLPTPSGDREPAAETPSPIRRTVSFAESPHVSEGRASAADLPSDGQAETLHIEVFERALAIPAATPAAPSPTPPTLAVAAKPSHSMLLLAAVALKKKAPKVMKRPAAAIAADPDGAAAKEALEDEKEDEDVEILEEADAPATPRKKPAAALAESGTSKRRCPPRIDYELTRNNLLVRTGLKVPGQAGSRSFGYGADKKYKDMKAAEVAAMEFIEELTTGVKVD